MKIVCCFCLTTFIVGPNVVDVSYASVYPPAFGFKPYKDRPFLQSNFSQQPTYN